MQQSNVFGIKTNFRQPDKVSVFYFNYEDICFIVCETKDTELNQIDKSCYHKRHVNGGLNKVDLKSETKYIQHEQNITDICHS